MMIITSVNQDLCPVAIIETADYKGLSLVGQQKLAKTLKSVDRILLSMYSYACNDICGVATTDIQGDYLASTDSVGWLAAGGGAA